MTDSALEHPSPLESATLCITVCTRQRPKMLAHLIESYRSLHIPQGVTVSLEIVENDTSPRVESMIRSLPPVTDRPVCYHFEPRLGIPFARNRCIAIAVTRGASHIAFIDDDEWFTDHWLETIWRYSEQQQHQAVIQGTVLSALDGDIPSYFQSFFQRSIPATGSTRNMCITNNLLVPMTVFVEHPFRFDESRPFAGGTDSKLFRQLHQHGVALINCAEAIMYERVTADRANYRWLTKRYFRIGLTLGEHRDASGSLTKLRFCTKRLLSAAKHALKAVLYLVSGRPQKRLKSWLKAAKTAGVALGIYHVHVDAYRHIEGE